MSAEDIRIDADLLVDAIGCTRQRAEKFAEALESARSRGALNTPERLAAFFAQIGHESTSLLDVRERWGPTPAQKRYEGRRDLGNLQPGDGKRYMGRGLLQTTGRANYAALRDRLRADGIACPDFEAEPETLEQPEWAAMSAVDYWSMRKINDAADAGDFIRVTKLVNGGTNGLPDRKLRWERAKKALGMRVAATSSSDSVVKGEPMVPFVAAALPPLLQAVPALIGLFKGDSPTSESNAKVAETVVGIAQEALGAVNAQQVVETLAADPDAAATVRAAIESRWFEIAEAGGGGIAGARQADAAFAASRRRSFSSPAFIISLVLLVFPLMLAIDLFYVHPESYNGELRTQIVTAILLCISIVGAFWLGSSYGSMRKTEAAQRDA